MFRELLSRLRIGSSPRFISQLSRRYGLAVDHHSDPCSHAAFEVHGFGSEGLGPSALSSSPAVSEDPGSGLVSLDFAFLRRSSNFSSSFRFKRLLLRTMEFHLFLMSLSVRTFKSFEKAVHLRCAVREEEERAHRAAVRRRQN
jgi:hypothetical protein